MLRFLAVVAASLSLVVVDAQAADSTAVRLAYNYMSQDMTTCTVFYMLSSKCLGKNNPELSEQIEKAASVMANRGADWEACGSQGQRNGCPNQDPDDKVAGPNRQ